jgi:hypothetical protein
MGAASKKEMHSAMRQGFPSGDPISFSIPPDAPAKVKQARACRAKPTAVAELTINQLTQDRNGCDRRSTDYRICLQVAQRFLRKRLRLPQLVVRVSRAAKADSQHSIILQHVEDSAHRIT